MSRKRPHESGGFVLSGPIAVDERDVEARIELRHGLDRVISARTTSCAFATISLHYSNITSRHAAEISRNYAILAYTPIQMLMFMFSQMLGVLPTPSSRCWLKMAHASWMRFG